MRDFKWIFIVALLVVSSSAVYAGLNSGATFSVDLDPAEGDQGLAEISGIEPGGAVPVQIFVQNAESLGGGLKVTFTLNPDVFNLGSTAALAPSAAFSSGLMVGALGLGLASATGVELGASFLPKRSDDAAPKGDGLLGTFNLTVKDDIAAVEDETIVISGIQLRSNATEDVFSDVATLSVNPPAPAPTVASIDPVSGSIAGGGTLTVTGANLQDGATVTIGGNAATDVAFVDATSLTATIPVGAEGAVDVVVSNPDGQSVTLAGGYEYLGIIEPTLTATSATDASLDYSVVGEGASTDGSAGEVTFSVSFTDGTGAAGEGQAISWAITNNGSETVYVLGEGEVAADGSLTVEVAAGADGSSSISLDAEGDKSAGTTSIAAVASVTAANSEGVDADLAVSFAATWEVPVAAELASFAGAVTPDDGVLLQWTVASQSNNLGWEVFRSTDDVAFEKVGDLVIGDGTSDEFKSYSFTDGQLPVADVLYYYLKQVDLDGTTARSSVIEVVLAATAVTQQVLPTASALQQNYPNPFNPETTISFDLSAESVVTLTVYSMTGQLVRTLADSKTMGAGQYKSVWDGRDENGAKVGSGVYFYQLNAGDFTAKKKMTLLQ